ncbi:MAG: efflux RND transporter periplasmic adaptor subunit [Hyphomicrobiales bacterium]|nr:efflux RND transporter periplasmic adaptor subunit [Hyphomicrobiales bacterium]
MTSHVLSPRGMAAAARFAVIALFLPLASPVSAADLKWEAVSAEVSMGKAIRLEVRLVGAAAPIPNSEIKVTSTRIDMGPDNMAAMDAPLRPLPSPAPGVFAFETDFVMAGRWALSLTATVPGQKEPVSGVVIFTVKDAPAKKSSEMDKPVEERKLLYYRNPMGLADVSPEPKKDWMGMDYIPVYEGENSGPKGSIQVSLDKVQRAGVTTEPVKRHMVRKTVRATGTVAPDERTLSVVGFKFDGFVDELYVKEMGVEVKAGEPLAKVWMSSQEVFIRQADFLRALGEERPSGKPMPEEINLRTFGFPDAAIANLKKTREPSRTLVWSSPMAGTVIEKPALQGMKFNAGDMLFKLADLSTVWVMAEVAERDLSAIRVGQRARVNLKAFPGEPFEGKVALILPHINMASRTAMLRIELPNPDTRIKLGLYADVSIDAEASDEPVFAIPASAIIDNGDRRVVFVSKGEGRFEPREVKLGANGGGMVEVREGLADGDEIVVTGNFLIDAESNLKAALSGFTATSAAEPAPTSDMAAKP